MGVKKPVRDNKPIAIEAEMPPPPSQKKGSSEVKGAEKNACNTLSPSPLSLTFSSAGARGWGEMDGWVVWHGR